jgi:hypothetical protein
VFFTLISLITRILLSYRFSAIQTQFLTRSVNVQHVLFHRAFSPSHLVKSTSWFSLVLDRFGSPLGTESLVCCNCYNWPFDECIFKFVELTKHLFRDWYVNRVSDIEFNNAASLLELLLIREGHFKCIIILIWTNQKLMALLRRLPLTDIYPILVLVLCLILCLIVVLELIFFNRMID